MAQKPFSEMADFGYENMSEEVGFVLAEMKLGFRALTKAVEKCATQSELQSVWRSAERVFAEKEECARVLNQLAKDQDMHNIYTQVVDITSAELLALSATPKTLITQPQAGLYVDVVHLEMLMEYNSAAYVVAADRDFSLEYASGEQIATFETTGFMDQASTQRRYYHHPSTLQNVITGQAVVLKTLNGELTTGDSPLKVKLHYYLREAL